MAAPRELRYVESPYLALRKSDPLERLLHFSRPLSGFSRLAFRLLWSQVDFLTQYRNSVRLYQPTPSCRTQELNLLQKRHTRSMSSFQLWKMVQEWGINLVQFVDFCNRLKKSGIYARSPLLWENGQSNFLVLQFAGICYWWKLHPD